MTSHKGDLNPLSGCQRYAQSILRGTFLCKLLPRSIIGKKSRTFSTIRRRRISSPSAPPNVQLIYGVFSKTHSGVPRETHVGRVADIAGIRCKGSRFLLLAKAAGASSATRRLRGDSRRSGRPELTNRNNQKDYRDAIASYVRIETHRIPVNRRRCGDEAPGEG